MRNGFWGNGVGRFVLSCTAISAIGLGIGAFGPGFLAWVSKPAQAQDVVVLPKDTKPVDTLSVPSMSLVPSAQAPVPSGSEQSNIVPASVRVVHGLPEPLVSTGPITAEEDAQLTISLDRAINPTVPANDLGAAAEPLQAFVTAHPSSNWNMAIETNLGMWFYQAGYFSRAIESWQIAWQLGRDATNPSAKRLADRALGELARMHARLGHAKELESLFAEAGDRKIEGAAGEFVAGARQGLWIFRNHPEIAYLCGPKALANVMYAMQAKPETLAPIQQAKSGPQGVNLSQLSALATSAGVQHQLIYRNPGQAIPVPSVVNWKLNHYAAILAEENGRYRVQDPTFASGEQLLTKEAIDAEASGYFLVPSGAVKTAAKVIKTTENAAQPDEWRIVASQSDEAKAVYGMGYATMFETEAGRLLDLLLGKDPGCPMCGVGVYAQSVSLRTYP